MSAAPCNIANALVRMAERQPHVPALFVPSGRDGAGRQRYVHQTYQQLDASTAAIAAGFVAAGIGRGVRTALLVRPSMELFQLMFGLFRAGAVPVLIDPGIGVRRMGRALAEAAPAAFVGIGAAHMARLLLGWGRASVQQTVVIGRAPPGLAGLRMADVIARGQGAAGAVAATAADEEAAILFTSGSTGAPKGAVYRHGNFQAQTEMLRDAFGIRPGEVSLPTFPPFALFDPALGVTTIIPDMDPTRPARVNPRHIVEAVDGFGVTTMFGSPALLDTLSRYGAATGTRFETLRRVISAGAPVRSAILARMRAMLPDDAEVFTPYGATESLPVAIIESREILEDTAAATDAGAGVCVGRPADGVQVRIIAIDDDPIGHLRDAKPVADGAVGEIVVASAATTTHYHARPEATAQAKMRDDAGTVWHRMGDLGRFDGQGRLWFCGRKAHRVRTAAGDLYTIPVEGVFNRHPAVFRTALVGVGPAGRQRPVICVEAEPGQQVTRQVVEELRALGAAHAHTGDIVTFLPHPGFPVDIRHNAKIGREELARWAARQLGTTP